MATESSSSRPACASSRLRSSRSSIRAWAPRRCASAVRAASRELRLSRSASRPAITAATSRRPTPASSTRSRRLARSCVRRSRSDSATLASRNARSAGVQRVRVRLRPLHRRAEPRAAIEVAGLPAARLPAAGRVAELAVQADPGAILLEPRAQRRPLADQHLVGDLRRPLAERDEPRLREPVEQRLDLLRGAPSGTSSSTATRRRVSSIPSPSSVRRRKRLRTSAWRSGGTASTTESAVCAIAGCDAAARRGIPRP